MTKGYQPLKTKKTQKIIPPNTGSHVHMKKDGYTWEDIDRSFWEGFHSAKNNMEKRITDLEDKNVELLGEIAFTENALNNAKAQIEKMKCCQNCDNWNWKHNKCEKKLKGDCFKASKWELRR